MLRSRRPLAVVADAAAKSLLQISPSGQIHLLARFPAVTETAPAGVFGPAPAGVFGPAPVTVKAQAVPISIAVGGSPRPDPEDHRAVLTRG